MFMPLDKFLISLRCRSVSGRRCRRFADRRDVTYDRVDLCVVCKGPPIASPERPLACLRREHKEKNLRP
jgi:hypothetical protein